MLLQTEFVLRLCNEAWYVGFLGRTIFLHFFFCQNAQPSFKQMLSEPEPTKQCALAAEPSKHSMTHYPASICDITDVTLVTSIKDLYATVTFSI